MSQSARAIFHTPDNQVLVQVRNHYGRCVQSPRQLQFPGGMVRNHETARQAVIREVKEELGIDLTEDQLTEYYRCNCRDSGHELVYFKVSRDTQSVWDTAVNQEPEKFDAVQFIDLADAKDFAATHHAKLFYACGWVMQQLRNE